MDKDCTLGASVTSYSNSASGDNSPIDMSAPRLRVSTLVSKFEGTDGGKGDMQASGNGYRYRHFSASWSRSLSGSSGSSTEVTKGFYCKSAPAYGCKYVIMSNSVYTAMLAIHYLFHMHIPCESISHVLWDCLVYSMLRNGFMCSCRSFLGKDLNILRAWIVLKSHFLFWVVSCGRMTLLLLV